MSDKYLVSTKYKHYYNTSCLFLTGYVDQRHTLQMHSWHLYRTDICLHIFPAKMSPHFFDHAGPLLRSIIVNSNKNLMYLTEYHWFFLNRWHVHLWQHCFTSSSWQHFAGCWWRVCCFGAKLLQWTWVRSDTWSITISSAGVQVFFQLIYSHSICAQNVL